MADIAVIFHWPPTVMDAMPLEELVMWHGEARKRSGAEE